MARDGELLRQVRRGLAAPFADTVRLPVIHLTRAEARAVERVLSASSSAAVGRKDVAREPVK